VVAEGLSTNIIGCWFSGFERAVDLLMTRGARATLEHVLLSHVIRDKGSSSPSGGSAVRVSLYETGGKARSKSASVPASLTLRRCTVVAEGLLEVRGNSPEATLDVEAAQLVFQGLHLITWSRPPGALGDSANTPGTDAIARQLRWFGRDNLYDLPEGPWIVAAAPANPSVPASAPSGLSAWNERFAGGRDNAGRRVEIRFINPKVLAEPVDPSIGPGDFALSDLGSQPIGADVSLVGP